jgi:hypothetical protein
VPRRWPGDALAAGADRAAKAAASAPVAPAPVAPVAEPVVTVPPIVVPAPPEVVPAPIPASAAPKSEAERQAAMRAAIAAAMSRSKREIPHYYLSHDFLTFVIGLHEAVDVDIPEADYQEVATLDGAVGYLSRALAGQVGALR